MPFSHGETQENSAISKERIISVTRGKNKIRFDVKYHLYSIDKKPLNGELPPNLQLSIDRVIRDVFDLYSIDKIRSGIKPEFLNWEIESRLRTKDIFIIIRITEFVESK